MGEESVLEKELNIAYEKGRMDQDRIIHALRRKGYRITKQRMALLNVILNSECTTCKEIYFQVFKTMPHMGISTIYRLLNILEEIGAIQRRNLSFIDKEEYTLAQECVVEFSGGERIRLSGEMLVRVMSRGMKEAGLSEDKGIDKVLFLR